MPVVGARGWNVLASSIVLLTASVCSAEPSEAEKQAAATLRKVSTNLQFNKDGTARLIRFSKPIVTDEHLAPLRELTRLDYVAIVCPQVGDAGIANVENLTHLDTLLLSESGVDDAGLKSLHRLAKLERLYLV